MALEPGITAYDKAFPSFDLNGQHYSMDGLLYTALAGTENETSQYAAMPLIHIVNTLVKHPKAAMPPGIIQDPSIALMGSALRQKIIEAAEEYHNKAQDAGVISADVAFDSGKSLEAINDFLKTMMRRGRGLKEHLRNPEIHAKLFSNPDLYRATYQWLKDKGVKIPDSIPSAPPTELSPNIASELYKLYDTTISDTNHFGHRSYNGPPLTAVDMKGNPIYYLTYGQASEFLQDRSKVDAAFNAKWAEKLANTFFNNRMVEGLLKITPPIGPAVEGRARKASLQPIATDIRFDPDASNEVTLPKIHSDIAAIGKLI